MRRRLFWSGLIGSGRLLLDWRPVTALAARIPTRARTAFLCVLRALGADTVSAAARFLSAFDQETARQEREQLT